VGARELSGVRDGSGKYEKLFPSPSHLVFFFFFFFFGFCLVEKENLSWIFLILVKRERIGHGRPLQGSRGLCCR
jgi:hypothetical protein